MWERDFKIYLKPNGEMLPIRISFHLSDYRDGFIIDCVTYTQKKGQSSHKIYPSAIKVLEDLFTAKGSDYIDDYYEGKRTYAAERRSDEID
ncbi:MAG TPA: hypothetical protein PKI14_01475 [Fervidobacterium sp.]|nr:hypothetical protein [Fervidobacterium sp.]